MGRMKEYVMADIMSPSIDEQLAEPTPPTRTLYQALSAAQAEMRNPTFDKVNPHFKSKFASLAAVRDAVVPVLARHGIAMTQTYDFYEGAQVLVDPALRHGSHRVAGAAARLSAAAAMGVGHHLHPPRQPHGDCGRLR